MSHRHADPSPTLLPLLAVKALLALAARDHSTARILWSRSKGEHNRNQLRRSRRMGVAAAFLALFAAIAAGVYWSPENCNHATDTGRDVEGAESGEVHALREADDLCHGANVAPAAASLPTMIDGAFQGEA